MAAQIPIVDYLVLADPPHLRAHVCTHCGAGYFDRRNACSRCGKTEFTAKALSNAGRLKAYTQIHRAARSVPVPFISAVVALDGGGVVKANLIGAELDDIAPDLPVTMTTFIAGVDDDGTEAVAFGYEVAK